MQHYGMWIILWCDLVTSWFLAFLYRNFQRFCKLRVMNLEVILVITSIPKYGSKLFGTQPILPAQPYLCRPVESASLHFCKSSPLCYLYHSNCCFCWVDIVQLSIKSIMTWYTCYGQLKHCYTTWFMLLISGGPKLAWMDNIISKVLTTVSLRYSNLVLIILWIFRDIRAEV